MFKKLVLYPLLIALIVAGPTFPAAGPVAEAAGGFLSVSGVGIMRLPDWVECKEAVGLEKQQNAGQQFDLVGLSQNTWHYARLVSYRMEQNLGAASLLFGIAEANPRALGEVARPLLSKSLEDNGGKILEWTPANKAPLGGRSVPVIKARLIMTDKVPLPMAATVYVFMHQDRLTALGLFSPDSDRLFWEQYFRQMATDMKWE